MSVSQPGTHQHVDEFHHTLPSNPHLCMCVNVSVCVCYCYFNERQLFDYDACVDLTSCVDFGLSCGMEIIEHRLE